MKIDKNNPLHWILLVWSGFWLIILMPFRLFKSKDKKPTIVFYGHELNGNLLALYNHWLESGYDCRFLVFNTPEKTRSLKSEGFIILNANNILDLIKLVKSDVFISSHGLHHFKFLRDLTSMIFIDVFHAPIFFKGFDSSDFKHLHGHDYTWVSSEDVKKIYIEKFGFEPEKVRVTGSARVESINKYMTQADQIKTRLGLSLNKKTILIAPTWKQDSKGRSIVPFGLSIDEFIAALLKALGDDVQIIFRAHLNSGKEVEANFPDVHFMPYATYPNAEEFLSISDVLINDWSSIAFDYLVLNRPVIFLDVEAPFAKGFTISPDYRCGDVVSSTEELAKSINEAVYHPEKYLDRNKGSMNKTKDMVFGSTLDGQTYERCDKQLKGALKIG